MNSLKPGFADELLKLALYDRLLALFRLSPWIILAMLLLVILFFLLNFNRLESGKRIQETDNAYTPSSTAWCWRPRSTAMWPRWALAISSR